QREELGSFGSHLLLHCDAFTLVQHNPIARTDGIGCVAQTYLLTLLELRLIARAPPCVAGCKDIGLLLVHFIHAAFSCEVSRANTRRTCRADHCPPFAVGTLARVSALAICSWVIPRAR